MPDNKQFTINFQPVGRRVIAESDKSLLTTAQDAGISLASICGGVGICDSCRIRLISGKLSELSLEENELYSEQELNSGYRLACQTYPESDLTIEIPPESLTAPQRLQVEGQEQPVQLDPPALAIQISLPEPSITDLRADTKRLVDGLINRGFSPPFDIRYPVLESLSPILRNNQWQVTVAMRKNSIVAVLPSSTPLFGLAVDVGTTKLAAYLCDLSTGITLAKSGAMNPQTAFGEDVISRISYSNNTANGNKTLQTRLIESLNLLIQDLCVSASRDGRTISSNQIVEAVVVGNTAMHHLFAGLPVHQLGVAPYVPAISEALELDANAIGLSIAPSGKIYLPPNIAGYVGADHVAMLLACGISSGTKTTVALDIGTNTEISLLHKDQLLSCSCASGPAFEGAHIQAGMRAAAGAVERVQIINGEFRIQTIDNIDPIGICGSGILDAIACLQEIGAIDHRGSFIPTHQLVRNINGQREFVLVDHTKTGSGRDLVITRKDINEIQLAKGAIRAGVELLLEKAGINASEIEDFIIAGAFGTYINVPSAVQLGMFPALPINRYHQVGNAAGAGARQMLLSMEQRHLAEKIAQRVNYIELSAHPDFSNVFTKSLYL